MRSYAIVYISNQQNSFFWKSKLDQAYITSSDLTINSFVSYNIFVSINSNLSACIIFILSRSSSSSRSYFFSASILSARASKFGFFYRAYLFYCFSSCFKSSATILSYSDFLFRYFRSSSSIFFRIIFFLNYKSILRSSRIMGFAKSYNSPIIFAYSY